jgi:hypothetical protein
VKALEAKYNYDAHNALYDKEDHGKTEVEKTMSEDKKEEKAAAKRLIHALLFDTDDKDLAVIAKRLNYASVTQLKLDIEDACHYVFKQ